MMSIFKAAIEYLTFSHGLSASIYRRLCHPGGEQWAKYLRSKNILHSMGEYCSIQTNVVITDPKYVRLGNNVRMSGCTLFGHDGSVNMINRAFGLHLDRVGRIDIKDNVFIGHGAIILPGVTIGPNALVAAGSVVTRDVGPDSVVAGVPAKRVCSLEESVRNLQEENEKWPWKHLLVEKPSADIQLALDNSRQIHFFGCAS